jgi:hypothetical protein
MFDTMVPVVSEGGRFAVVRTLVRGGATLVKPGETIEASQVGRWVSRTSPECAVAWKLAHDKALCDDARATYGELFAYLRGVRLAGGWREYVVEQRRSLATLRALWLRRHSSSSSSAGAHAAASTRVITTRTLSDVALLSMVFDRLPVDVGGKILRFYTELRFF